MKGKEVENIRLTSMSLLPIQNFLQPLLSSYLSKVFKHFFFKFTFSGSFPVGDLISNGSHKSDTTEAT